MVINYSYKKDKKSFQNLIKKKENKWNLLQIITK